MRRKWWTGRGPSEPKARPVLSPAPAEALLDGQRAAMGVVAAGVAHDLNHALNVLSLRIAALERDPALERSRHQLDELRRVVADATRTVARLQDLARRRRDVPGGAVQLAAVLDAALERARSEAEDKAAPGAEVRFEMDLPPLPPVNGSAAELSHVFLDLLLNALDGMPCGGLVHVRGAVEGDSVRVDIADEGPGVPEQHLDRVFDPFFTLSAARDTGLGLSIARNVMDRLGGEITVQNRRGAGALWTLRFPLAHEGDRPGEAVPSVPPERKISVLLVDDEADNLDVLRDLLELDGHHVDVAQSGRAALDLLRSGHRYDLVLCDVGMPGMSGWQVAREAQEIAPGTRLYMLTGWANEIAKDDPRARLVKGVLAKPLDPDRLSALLAEAAHREEPLPIARAAAPVA